MSELSAEEMIQIIATWKGRGRPAGKTIDRSQYSEEQLRAFDEHIKEKFQPVKVLGLFVFTVPWDHFPEFPCFHFYREAYWDYEARRVYPHEGALDSQLARTVEILKLIGALVEEETKKRGAIRVHT